MTYRNFGFSSFSSILNVVGATDHLDANSKLVCIMSRFLSLSRLVRFIYEMLFDVVYSTPRRTESQLFQWTASKWRRTPVWSSLTPPWMCWTRTHLKMSFSLPSSRSLHTVSGCLSLSISLHISTPFPSLSLIHGQPSENIHYFPHYCSGWLLCGWLMFLSLCLCFWLESRRKGHDPQSFIG